MSKHIRVDGKMEGAKQRARKPGRPPELERNSSDKRSKCLCTVL